MECAAAKKMLSEYTANGLLPEEEELLLAHLEGCEQCALLLESVDEELFPFDRWQAPELPQGFEQRIWARLKKEGAEPSHHQKIRGRSFFKWRLAWVPAGAVAAVLLIFLARGVINDMSLDRANHVLSNPRMIEMISTQSMIEEQDIIENLEFLEEYEFIEALEDMEEGKG